MWEPFLANTDIFTLPTTLGSSPRDRFGRSRPCKLWFFSVHLLADFLFSRALDGSKPGSQSPDILRTSYQLHSIVLQSALHSRTQHLCSDSFLPPFFSPHICSFPSLAQISRCFESRICAHCSSSLSLSSFTKSSGRDLLFSYGLVIRL